MVSKRSKKTYHLVNDYHLLAYESVDSTNEEARRLAEGGACHGAVIWAKEQTHGRGRLRREWESKPGNLFVSILLAPDCELKDAAQLSFLSAVAAVKALQPLLPGDGVFTCKWPNDILLGDEKLGGILLESFTTTDEEKPQKQTRWVVVGIGLNIDSYPEQALYPATCLKKAGVELVSAKIVLTRLIEHFMDVYDRWAKDGFSPIRKAWLEHAYGVGREVRVQVGNETHDGVFTDLGENGEMLLARPGGDTLHINCGDVFFNPVKAITTRKN